MTLSKQLNRNQMDETDWAILHELQQDARLSYAELGRRVNLSSPAVQERVHKLEDAGIIAGYHAKVNPKALGLSILAITRLVNVASDIKDYLAETAQARPEVLQCYQVTGQDEFILHIVVESMEHLRDVLRLFSPHAQLITSIVINTPVANRIISFENLPNIQENNL